MDFLKNFPKIPNFFPGFSRLKCFNLTRRFIKVSQSYLASAFGTSSSTHPHAYSDITIQNGQVQSKTCIEKQPGSNY